MTDIKTQADLDTLDAAVQKAEWLSIPYSAPGESTRDTLKRLQEAAAAKAELIDNFPALLQLAREALVARGKVERLLNVARGCHDFGGGHHGDGMMDAYQHGIQTVINALEAAVKNNPSDTQINVLEQIGAWQAAKEDDHD